MSRLLILVVAVFRDIMRINRQRPVKTALGTGIRPNPFHAEFDGKYKLQTSFRIKVFAPVTLAASSQTSGV